MKTNLIAIIFFVLLTSCTGSRLEQSEWIKKESEDRLLSIKEEEGMYWISIFETSYEIESPHSNPYVQLYDRKMPIDISKDQSSLFMFNTEYIPLHESVKGRFLGEWKSLDDNTQLIVKMDSNIELNWDFISDSGKAIRYYPKRIANGVHFTMGQDTLSYEIKDGYIIGNNGARYSRVKG